MTTQYTSILKLALPVQGELSGTWGDVVNDNITSMVEEAIAGRAVINTWTANAHTLTSANGTTSESRCAMLEFTDTGTALTGDATVICPTAAKIYICKNDAGQKVTIKTSAGTGVDIADGQTMFVFCDGTNVVEAVTSMSSLKLGTAVTSIEVTSILDEDDLVSDSATALATQQSIKAYVDSQVTAQDLDFGGDSGTGAVDLDSQTFTIAGTSNEIETSASGQTLTVGLPAAVTVTTSVTTPTVQTTNLNANDGTSAVTIADTTGQTTITDAVLTTADINGGTADNVVIGGTTAAAGSFTTVGATGNITSQGQVITDTINEQTATSGVTVDGVLLKDDVVNATDIETSTISANDGTTAINIADSTGAVDIDTSLNVDGTVLINGANALTLRNDTSTDADEPKLTFDNDTFAGANHANIRTGNGGLLLKIESPSTSTYQNRHQLVLNGGASADFQYNLSTDNGSNYINYFKIDGGNVVFNATGVDKDFRVESADNTHMLFVDGGSDRVGVGYDTPQTELHVARTDITTYSTDGTSIQNDVTLKLQNEDLTTNNIMEGIHIRAGTWDGGVIGSPLGNGSNNNGFLALISEAQEGVRFYNDGANGGTVFNEHGVDRDFRVESDANANMLIVDGAADQVRIGQSSSSVPSSVAKLYVKDGITTDYSGELSLSYQVGNYYNYYKGMTGVNPFNDSARGLHIFNFDSDSDTGIQFWSGSSESASLYTMAKFSAGSTGSVVFNDGGFDRDFRVESNNNANMLFVDASTDRIGIGTSSPATAMLHVANDPDSASWHDDNTIIYTLDGSIQETQQRQMFTIEAGSTRTSCHARITFIPRSTGGIGAMYGGYMDVSINRADGGVAVVVERIQNASGGSGSVSMMTPTVSGNVVTFGMYAGNNGTSSTYSVETRIELTSHSPTNWAVSDVSSTNTTHTGTALRGGWYIGGNTGQNTISYRYNDVAETVINDSSENVDFRVESDTSSHALFVDASLNRIGINQDVPGYTVDVVQGNNSNTNGIAVKPQNETQTMIYSFLGMRNTYYTTFTVDSGDTGSSSYNYFQFFSGTEDVNGELLFLGDTVTHFNNGGHDRDFRVESDTEANMLVVDAGANQVRLATNAQLFSTTQPKLEIYDNSGTSGGVGVKLQSGTSTSYAGYNYWGRVNGSGTTHYAFAFYDGPSGTLEGTISVTSSGTSYNTSSDYRLKENVVELTGATERLKQLEPKRFNFIKEGDTPTVDGFLAHEVSSVVPEAVTGTHNEVDADGSPVYQGIDQSKLVPLLVATIKELEARITALENA